MKEPQSVLRLLAPIEPLPETLSEWKFLREATQILVDERGELWVRQHREVLLDQWEWIQNMGFL